MSAPLKLGLIGLDTSHVTAFTKLLNDEHADHHIPGARVTAGYPGGTRGWERSEGRVGGFTEQLRDQYQVAILETPEAVAQQADVVAITAVDGRVHRELFERVAPAGKPVFIDKPFATSSEDAEAMVARARSAGIALMSCSALRYAQAFTEALGDDAAGPVKGVDVFGPMALEDQAPGMFWYGCHSVEMVVAAMGVGCREVRAASSEGVDVFTLVYADGRVATIRGARDTEGGFGATLHRARGVARVDVSQGQVPYYVSLLRAIVSSLPRGRSDVPHPQMLEVVRIMEAGNRARGAAHGEAAPVKPVTPEEQ